jgi:hypothetical protein
MNASFRRARDAGMNMVMVETGGDPGHAPARATYEKAGFERWPVAATSKSFTESLGELVLGRRTAPERRAGFVMACRISELVLGCPDPEVLARFRCEVLDFVVLDREDEVRRRSGRTRGSAGRGTGAAGRTRSRRAGTRHQHLEQDRHFSALRISSA